MKAAEAVVCGAGDKGGGRGSNLWVPEELRKAAREPSSCPLQLPIARVFQNQTAEVGTFPFQPSTTTHDLLPPGILSSQ